MVRILSTVRKLSKTIKCRNSKLFWFLVILVVNTVFIYGLYLKSNQNIYRPMYLRGKDNRINNVDLHKLTTEKNNSLFFNQEKHLLNYFTPRIKSNESAKPSLQQAGYQDKPNDQNTTIFDCETVLVFSTEDTISQSNVFTNSTTEPTKSPGRHQQNYEFHNQTFRTSKWCGRTLQKADSVNSSFTLLSDWLSKGGVNIVDLMQRSIFSCSLRCSQTFRRSTILHDPSPGKLPQTHNSPMDAQFIHLTNQEINILKTVPPAVDVGLISNENKSQVIILTPVKKVKVGDIVSFRVDLFDGYGRTKKEGGDEIRVWIYDHSLGAGSPGTVVDLNNGSFLANVTVRWTGKQEVSVALHHPREIIRTMIFLRHVLGTMRYLTSAFENGSHGETTPCMWYPVIPGYDDICDLTSLNGGLPWFCGKPVSISLTCADWVRAQSSEFLHPLPVTESEQFWLDKMNREPYIRIIPFRNSSITVTGKSTRASVTPCWSVRHAVTWRQQQPTGWFFRKKWRSSICDTQDLTKTVKRNWLKNKRVYFLGDSNMKKLFQTLRSDVCTMNAPTELPFPGPMNCSNPDLGTHVLFRAHAHPFNLPHPDHFRKYNKPLSHWVDQIEDHEDVLVVCHLYLHFSQFTIPLYVIHVKDILKGVVRLLDRNPRARVVIRGTHVTYKGWPVHAAGGDFMAFQFNTVLKQEFSALQDAIMYLDGWDMTLANENLNFHPEEYVNVALLNQIFNHFIGRP